MDRIFPTTDVHPSRSALPTEPGACESNTVGSPEPVNFRLFSRGHSIYSTDYRQKSSKKPQPEATCSASLSDNERTWAGHHTLSWVLILFMLERINEPMPFLRMQLQNCSLLGIIKGGPCKLNNLWDKFHIPKRRSACFLAAVTPADAERRAHSAAVAIDTTLFKSFTTSSASVPWKVGVHWRELQFSVGNSGDSIIQDSEKTHLKNKQLLVGKISLISAIFLFVASITYRCENIIKAKLSTCSRSATRSNQKIAR